MIDGTDQRYQLKWSSDDCLQISNITNQEINYSSMLKWLKGSCSQTSKSYSNHLIIAG
ncbi:MAG TPA: hypothetical protein VIZ62_05185 [Nitrososphaeraceae archaeon]